MDITLYETVEKKVRLNKSQMKEVALQYLKELVYPGEYLREIDGDTYVMEDDEHYHGSISELRVRPATATDIKIFNMLNLLRELK